MPAALSKFGGAKFKIISGYAGSTEAELALQRGEAELAASVSLLTVQQKYPAWLKDRAAPILYQSGLVRSPLLPDVPSLGELGTDQTGTMVLRAIGASSEFGKSVLTTPDLPKANLALLRNSFNTMMTDPAFIAKMNERGIPINLAKGEDMDKLAAEVKNTPSHVIEHLKSLTKQ
jgi:tripartite-type tricarboxylate transporter receptor subunit TctC